MKFLVFVETQVRQNRKVKGILLFLDVEQVLTHRVPVRGVAILAQPASFWAAFLPRF